MHKEYLKIDNYLWERIDATDNHDLEALGIITFDLMKTFGVNIQALYA
jgi:hypothetical protein